MTSKEKLILMLDLYSEFYFRIKNEPKDVLLKRLSASIKYLKKEINEK